MKNYAIILASGSGVRFGSETPKQFIKIAGKTVLEHTIEIFENASQIDETIIVISPEYRYVLEEILLKNSYKKVTKILNGGATRKESSSIGIFSISEKEANVIIHDCARPFLSQRIISDCVDALQKYDAIDVAIQSADTIIQINDEKIIQNIPERIHMQRGQTPQCFKLSIIKKAHELAQKDDNFTDDCGLVIKYNLGKVYVVEGENDNIKITYPEDIFLADKLFQIHSISVPETIDLNNLKDKVIVAFGGFSGIGQCIVDLAEKHRAKVFPFGLENGYDVSDYNSVQKALEEVYEKTKRIDYVVNSAGLLKIGKLLDRKIEDIHKEIDINYMGSIHVCKASISYLKESKGSIALFASSSYTRGRALYSTYSSTKAGIVNLTQALAEELYADNIRLNVMSPERTATPMRFAAFGKEPEGSLLQPEIVADSTLKALLSNLTGQVIDVRRKK